MKAVAVIVAGGKSIRFGGETPKQFALICGRMLLGWTIAQFETASSIGAICVVVPEEAIETVSAMTKRENFRKVKQIVAGGATRSQSVLAGLRAFPDRTGLVAIHDGARPLVAPEDIDRVVAAAAAGSAAILAVPASDAIKKSSDGLVRSTIDRTNLYYAQTPQVFELSVILRAHEARGESVVADDSALVENQGVRVQIVEPTFPNIKVTRPEDIRLIEGMIRSAGRG